MLLVVGAAATFAAPADRRPPAGRQEGPCGQITAACESAGFARGNAKGGAGLQVDCIAPDHAGERSTAEGAGAVAECRSAGGRGLQGEQSRRSGRARPGPARGAGGAGPAGRARPRRSRQRRRRPRKPLQRPQAAQHRLHPHRRSGLESRPVHAACRQDAEGRRDLRQLLRHRFAVLPVALLDLHRALPARHRHLPQYRQ